MSALDTPENRDAAERQLNLQLRETQQLLQLRLDDLNKELVLKNKLLARHLLEKERERNTQQQILNSMSSAVILVELDGRIRQANPSARALLALPDLPVSAAAVLPEQLATLLESVIREAKTIERDDFRLLQDDEEQVFRLRCRLVYDDAQQPIGVLLILDDLTGIHQMEERMAQVRTLAALGEMAASVAHELRNPLGGIGGFAALLQNRLKPETKERHYVNKIIEGVDGLNKVATNLLAYTRKVEPTFHCADLRTVLREVLSFIQIELDQMECAIELVDASGKEAATLMMDPELMRQTFLNLCKNAVQAMQGRGDKTGKLSLELESSSEGLQVDVCDTGPGIPREQRRKLFNPFFTTRAKGTGLGLAIVKKNIELHGGSIELLDSKNGAHFRVRFPNSRKS